MVTRELMAVHLSLDLRQVEKPEIARLYQEVKFPVEGILMPRPWRQDMDGQCLEYRAISGYFE